MNFCRVERVLSYGSRKGEVRDNDYKSRTTVSRKRRRRSTRRYPNVGVRNGGGSIRRDRTKSPGPYEKDGRDGRVWMHRSFGSSSGRKRCFEEDRRGRTSKLSCTTDS